MNYSKQSNLKDDIHTFIAGSKASEKTCCLFIKDLLDKKKIPMILGLLVLLRDGPLEK